jgi:hypothetical protein
VIATDIIHRLLHSRSEDSTLFRNVGKHWPTAEASDPRSRNSDKNIFYKCLTGHYVNLTDRGMACIWVKVKCVTAVLFFVVIGGEREGLPALPLHSPAVRCTCQVLNASTHMWVTSGPTHIYSFPQLCHSNKTHGIRPQNSRDKLAHLKAFPSIVVKQAPHLQNSAKTSMDVWIRTVGMCF